MTPGDNQPFVVSGLVNITDIAVGQNSFFAVSGLGQVWAWGFNDNGMFGMGNFSIGLKLDNPTLVPSLNNIAQVRAGKIHAVFLTKDGSVYSSGAKSRGRLGIGEAVNQDVWTPTKIDILGKVVYFDVGEEHSLFITENGKLYGCGSNIYAQLGHSISTDKWIPTVNFYMSLYSVRSVSTFHTQTVVITSDLQAYGFGNTMSTAVDTSRPIDIPFLPGNIKSIAGFSHALVNTDDGDLYSLGSCDRGQCGQGDRVLRFSPVKVAVSNVTQISVGASYSIIVLSDGKLMSFGSNTVGNLGLNDTLDRLVPTPVVSVLNVGGEIIPLTNVTSVSAGSDHVLIIVSGKFMFVAGKNTNGELGLGDLINRHVFVNNTFIVSNIAGVAAGAGFSYFWTDAGTVYSWGAAVAGACRVIGSGNFVYPTYHSAFSDQVKISAGSIHVLFLNKFGQTYSCGDNWGGVGCSGTYSTTTTPQYIASLGPNVADISAEHANSFFLGKNGLAYSCGYNDYGQLGFGDAVTRASAPNHVPNYKNVIAISGALDAMLIINSCPNGTHVGGNCQYPTCGGLPSTYNGVCSGSGVCVSYNKCVCESPSTGDTCQYRTYYWLGGENDKWSASGNWVIKRSSGVRVIADTIPTQKYDIVVFDQLGIYSVVIDSPDILVEQIQFLPGASPTLKIDGGTLSVTRKLSIPLGISLILQSGALNCAELEVNGIITVVGGQLSAQVVNIQNIAAFGSNLLDSTKITASKSISIQGELTLTTLEIVTPLMMVSGAMKVLGDVNLNILSTLVSGLIEISKEGRLVHGSSLSIDANGKMMASGGIFCNLNTCKLENRGNILLNEATIGSDIENYGVFTVTNKLNTTGSPSTFYRDFTQFTGSQLRLVGWLA